MRRGADDLKAGMQITLPGNPIKHRVVIRHADGGQIEERTHGGRDDLRLVKIHTVAGQNQSIRSQRVGGADDGAQVAMVGRTIKQNIQRAGAIVHQRGIIRPHAQDGQQLGGIGFAA